ncbi:DUF3370 domain-containing protein [Phormidesmis priestleyi]
MLSFLPILLAQATPNLPPKEIIKPQEVRALPGQLDSVLVFNSNSPEVVQQDGILLSTFPPIGKRVPTAHLDQAFEGRFDIFAHHIAKALTPEDLRTLYLGIIVHNPGQVPVTVDTLQAASYLSQPDAPFLDIPSFVDNPIGSVFAGPGSRAVNEVLRGQRQEEFSPQLVIPPGESRMILNVPIPVKPLTPPLNGRSTLMRLRSTGKVYIASLGMFAKTDDNGNERAPTLEEWQTLLDTGDLVTPRDQPPTPLSATQNAFAYGRVAGVAVGSQWLSQVVDRGSDRLNIPNPGQAFSYGLSLLYRGTMGTGQNQNAKVIKRYPDTAYEAHGNYGIEYNLAMPLYNPTSQDRAVTLAVENPLKREDTQQGLRFFEPPARSVFFRGTVRVRYKDDAGLPQTRSVHLVLRRGQQGDPLVTLNLKPGERRLVEFDFIYPPDATPPQVLTVRTLD